MSTPNAILLDLDNTVYSYDRCHEAGIVTAWQAGRKFHSAWAERTVFVDEYRAARDRVKQHTGHHGARHCRLLYFKSLAEHRLGGTAIGPIQAMHDAYWTGYFDELTADPGCRETLEALRSQGTRLCWVTNFTTERQFLKLTELGLADPRDLIVTSEEAGAEKPALAPFQLALKRLDVQAKDAWFIGDDFEADIRPSLALSLNTIWFNRDKAIVPKEAQTVVTGWREIADLFFNKKRAVG